MRKQKSYQKKKTEKFSQKIRAQLEEKPMAKTMARPKKKQNEFNQKARDIKNVAHLFVEHLQIFAICSAAASTVAATINHH